MKTSEKLKTARIHLNKDQKEMARATDTSYRTWQAYEREERFPSGKVFKTLAELGFNASWFFTEDESIPMLIKDAAGKPVQDIQQDGTYVQIPRYEVAASAGGGAIVHSEQIVDHLSFRADWVKNALGVPLQSLALINVIGDSMEPTLSDGDVVLLDMTTTDITDSSIYALQINGSLLVKRIQRRLDGSIIVKSDNKQYDPETVSSESADQLNIVGRVVWAGCKF